MTAVAAPTSYQSHSRSGWTNDNGNNNGQEMSLNSTMPEETARSGAGHRKMAQRSNSSSSLSSTGSTSSSATISSQSNGVQNGELTWAGRKKPTRGLWPPGKAEPVSGLTTARPQSVPPSPSGLSAASAISALVPTQSTAQLQAQQTSGPRTQEQPEGTSVLYLSPLNGTFERKTINVPYTPDVLRIGRQTNQKTVPTPTNGYFDSKVLSRQHAEVWADREGRIWIRDVKSSNGTFINGTRLSPENRDSEPHLIKDQDHLELGIDIVSEDHKHIVHHKVSARVERAGPHSVSQEQQEIPTREQPSAQAGNGPPSQPQGQVFRSRSSSQGQVNGQNQYANPRGNLMTGVPAYQAKWLQPVAIEQIVKRLNGELKQSRSQRHTLSYSNQYVTAVMGDKSLPPPPSQKLISPNRTFDLKTRYSVEPPAPPPQQPLPEKPDGPALRTKTNELSGVQPMLRRSNTERPKLPNGTINHKSSKQHDQDSNLVEMLSTAQKEISTQSEKLKEMEKALRKEREARGVAEAHVSRLESSKLNSGTDHVLKMPLDTDTKHTSLPSSNPLDSEEDVPARVQHKLDLMRTEMDGMRLQMERYRQRAEIAEADSEKNRKTLMEMVKIIRDKQVEVAAGASKEPRKRSRRGSRDDKEGHFVAVDGTDRSMLSDDEDVFVDVHADSQSGSKVLPDGGVNVPSNDENPNYKGPRRRSMTDDSTILDHLSRLKSSSSDNIIHPDSTTLQQQRQEPNDANTASTTSITVQPAPQGALVQSAPYAAMLGVVFLGVGMMAYLNGWHIVPRER